MAPPPKDAVVPASIRGSNRMDRRGCFLLSRICRPSVAADRVVVGREASICSDIGKLPGSDGNDSSVPNCS